MSPTNAQLRKDTQHAKGQTLCSTANPKQQQQQQQQQYQ
jgi:hypothetical protein